jgi:hypothetical protein
MKPEPLSNDELSSFLTKIEQSMHAIASGSTDTYEAGRIIWAAAFENSDRSPNVAWPLWLIWGALTDVVEVQPANRATAEAKMRQAAEEWLALPAKDDATRKAYLDRWVYHEIGYEPPMPAAI